MFREKYLISQRGFPNGWFQGAAKPAAQTEAQKSPELSGNATEVRRRVAAENAAKGRREMMEKVVPEIANRILEKIFGHNADLVKQEIGPKYEQIIENIGGSLKKPGDKYLKSVLKEDGVHIIFQLDGHPVDMNIATVLLLSDEEVKTLEPLITLKREKRMPEAKPETVWSKAEKVIQGEIKDVIFAFKPDDVPDTLEVEEILATPMIKEIRAKLVKSYKAGKPYEVNTTDKGFKLESQDSKNFPDREFNIEQFWEEFWSEYVAAENAEASESEAIKPIMDRWQDAILVRSGEFADVVKKLDPTEQLDEDWKGRKAEDMALEDFETLMFGNTEAGIEGRSIAEIEEIYGEIPNWGEMPIRDALFERAEKLYFPSLDIQAYQGADREQLLEGISKIRQGCSEVHKEFMDLNDAVRDYPKGSQELKDKVRDVSWRLHTLQSTADIKTAAAARLFLTLIGD